MRGRIGGGLLLWSLCCTGTVFAATNAAQEPEELTLLPPLPEIAPTLWERYGVWIVLGVVAAIVLAVIAWSLMRPKPPPVPPIEVQVRARLAALRSRPEDGRALSEVSRHTRFYLQTAFHLPPGEFTTADFIAALHSNPAPGAELADRASEFLRKCDEAKFSPGEPAGFGAIDRALEIVDLGEARRQTLRLAAASTPPVIVSAK